MSPKELTDISERDAQFQRLPKVLLHEHLDCSLRPQTMLEMWNKIGFAAGPENFPADVATRWKNGNQQEAIALYQKFLQTEASKSLSRYVQAIVYHILPLMQTTESLTRITRERMEDAAADGIVAMQLRFAPQLHTHAGLTLHKVMDAIIAGLDKTSIPVVLVVCALRHEDEDMARKLVDLAIEYRSHVRLFDLAGDEHANPGVLAWWARQAARAREHGIEPDIHLWETDQPKAQDIERLVEYGIDRIGHGVQGELQGSHLLEVCPTSNLITGVISSIQEHPVDRLLKSGKRVTINTDGTLLTATTLSGEYKLLAETFGWGHAEFHHVNLTALHSIPLPEQTKNEIGALLSAAYIDSKSAPS